MEDIFIKKIRRLAAAGLSACVLLSGCGSAENVQKETPESSTVQSDPVSSAAESAGAQSLAESDAGRHIDIDAEKGSGVYVDGRRLYLGMTMGGLSDLLGETGWAVSSPDRSGTTADRHTYGYSTTFTNSRYTEADTNYESACAANPMRDVGMPSVFVILENDTDSDIKWDEGWRNLKVCYVEISDIDVAPDGSVFGFYPGITSGSDMDSVVSLLGMPDSQDEGIAVNWVEYDTERNKMQVFFDADTRKMVDYVLDWRSYTPPEDVESEPAPGDVLAGSAADSTDDSSDSGTVLPERAYKYRLQPLNGTYRDTCDENGYVVDKKDGVVDTVLLRDYDDHSCRAVFPMLVVSDPGVDTTSGEDPNDRYSMFTSKKNGVTLMCSISSSGASDLETWKESTEAYKFGTAASENPGTYADRSTRYDNIQMSGLVESGNAVFSEWVADERVLANGAQGVFFQLYGSMPVKDSYGNWHGAEIVCMGHADQDDEDAVMAMNETRNELYTALGLTIGDP